MEYDQYLNKNFDDVFLNEMQLPWLPWVGIDYEKSDCKTMVLGESTYNWKPGDNKIAEKIADINYLRWLHFRQAIFDQKPSRYTLNLTRAIFSKSRPAKDMRTTFWTQVIYHNLVLSPMLSLKHRPTDEDYKRGWYVFLKLLSLLGPDQCIVYGLEKRKIHLLHSVLDECQLDYLQEVGKEKIGSHHPVCIRFSMNNRPFKMVFIRHPSAFFKWKEWGKYLHEELHLQNHLECP